ncbi:pectinesterase inhibitor-like [Lycium barbarum]|uniref:pectinesterase inhibitor-like n=1 Tax=Lycium barbarum TaxID=112863 RepID=UPI00293E7F7F|nr:pectinesterase inhibitor-like [Lycium barbarum]
MYSMRKLIVIFFISLSLITFSSGDLIDDVCRKSRDFKVCTTSLRADPKSSSADEKGLIRILLQQCLAKATSIYNEIVNLLKETKEPVLKECLQICKDNYDGSNEDLIDSIKYFDASDYFSLKISAAGATNGAVTCEEAFTEPPVRKSPIKSENDNFADFVHLTMSLIPPPK